jgi:hypothetical protein
MEIFGILAQTAHTAATTANQTVHSLVPVDQFWEQIKSLNVVESLTVISFGLICFLYGWRVFKLLVVIGFGLIGLVLGMAAADRIIGLNNELIGGLIGMALLAILSVPLMKWAVSILGAFAGAVIAAGIWYACGLQENYLWAGALIGIVTGGMASFVIFKVAVMLFTSLWGSTLIASGLLALLYINKFTTKETENLVLNHKWFIPFVIFAPTLIGLIVQNKMVKEAKDWNM